MKAYQSKYSKIKGTDFHEVRRKAFRIYSQIKNRTKRRPYIRSAYFKKDKIFITPFWEHLFGKQKWRDRMRRLKYFEAAIELIKNNNFAPTSKDNPNNQNEILHRFAGITREQEIFYVQIKENKRTGQKNLISIFPKQ